MKTVVPPLAVCDGEKEPHRGALPHVATQSTPAFAGSLLTVADTGTGLPTIKEAGGACVMATEMIGVCDEGSAFDPVIAQPVIPIIPSKDARPTTNGRNGLQKLQKVRSLNSG